MHVADEAMAAAAGARTRAESTQEQPQQRRTERGHSVCASDYSGSGGRSTAYQGMRETTNEAADAGGAAVWRRTLL